MARNITFIPAQNQNEVRMKAQNIKKLRMAAYCRVSTDQEDQLHSFDAQVNYYKKYIEEHEQYELADIYADEGISGTNVRKRVQFKRMIEDCRQGKIDIVITKSISRFARNTQDCLTYMRELKNLGIPIIFEKENINSMESTGELLFTILSSLAQDESRNISENCKWGIRTKFKKGELHLNTSNFLGYDKDENGKLVINPEQAKIVRRIYDQFLGGRNPQEIAEELERMKVPGCNGQTKWYASTVIGILKNEKHKGDALLQKTYTADFMTKKQVRNNGEIAQVYIEDNHEGIIDKEMWEAVQEEFQRRDAFMERHGLKRYTYGADSNPFTCKIFCKECGRSYNRHAWKSRGIAQWQCKGHRINGVLTCRNAFVDEENLKKGFVKAYNRLMANEKKLSEWEEKMRHGTSLEKIRAKQMIELSKQKPLENMVTDLAKLVIQEVVVRGAKSYEFVFMDGSKINVNI